MRKPAITAIVAVVASVATALVVSASASATSTVSEASLFGDSPLLGTQTTTNVDGAGASVVSTVSLDTDTASIAIGSDGFPCGDVAYNAIQKWEMAITNWVMWTYHQHFGVHVCHNKVVSKTSFYDEPTSVFYTWSWCGNIIKEWGMNPNNASAHSHTKGCFQLVDKVVSQKYPWAKITIGGNGHLWARSTGVDG